MTDSHTRRLVNLTGRSITLLDWHGSSAVVPDRGAPARYIERLMDPEPDEWGITWIEIVAAGPVGIPPPKDGVFYIVNKAVAIAMAVSGTSRDDVVITNDVVRNKQGLYIGVRNLARLV